MKRIFQILLWLLTVLVIIIIVKTLLFSSLQVSASPVQVEGIGAESVAHLSEAVSIPTISYLPDSPVDTFAFKSYMEFIKKTYPLVHEKLEREVFNNFSMLYRWKGEDTSLRPMVLMAHYDVVPPGDTASWERKPFSGYFDGTYIWGRGTLDDKAAMISILEAVEALLGKGYKPERTLYLSFGHDEELAGNMGAGTIAESFKKRGIKPDFVLDEGMAITNGMIPMMKKPVALVGTSEKGYLTVKLSADMPGGHSSTPEKESAITVVNSALNKLEEKQMNPEISGPVNDFIRYIGPEMPFYAKAIFANKWIFKCIIIIIYTGSSSGNALVRTTIAPTMINAGIKDNVIPTKAEAVVNFRIIPGETSTIVIAHIRKVIDDDRIKIEADNTTLSEPAPVSPVDVPGFRFISLTIRQIYPDAVVSPTLMLGSSDSRHFSAVTRNIYRFAPIVVTSEDMARIHGLNERTKADDFRKGIGFYYQLIVNLQGKL
jgi:carboxypeptidase PM20D1